MEFLAVVLCASHCGEVTNFMLHLVERADTVFVRCRIGPLILLIFFGMLLFGYVYVYLFIPETKGLTLEEVRRGLIYVS